MKSAWQWKQLGAICKTGAGGTPLKAKKDYYEGGTIPWLLSGEVSQGEIQEATNFITQKGLENSAAKLFPKNTVLVAMYGATAGQVGILRFEAATNQAVCGILPNTNFIPEFMFYFLLSKKDELVAQATGNAQPNISQIKIRNTDVPVIPLSEQQRIVSVLNQTFEDIAITRANAERNIRNARAIFESYLQSVFTQRGKGWVELAVGEICDIKHGFAFDGAEFSSAVPDGKPLVITPGNFTENGKLLFNERNTKRFSGVTPPSFQFDVGDLVVVMTDLSSKMKILGKPAFVEADDILHNQRIGRVVFSNDRVEKRLLYYFMMTEGFLKNIKGSATGTMVKHTAPKRILSNVIPFPKNRQEQRAIISKLDDLREETQRLVAIYERKLTALEALKKSLLHQAFSGKLTKQSSASSVVAFPRLISNVTPTDMHAGILALAYKKHENRSRERTFGHVKAEKIAHMVESHVGIDCGRNPVKDAAGPNDYRHLKQVEHRAEKAGYFSFKQNATDSYSFRKLRRFDQLTEKTRVALGDGIRAVDQIIDLMVPMQTQQAEIFATVYAAWNNLLLDGKAIFDEAIVSEAREKWHRDKLKIPRDKFFKAIDWMREKNVVPKGRGKRVVSRTAA